MKTTRKNSLKAILNLVLVAILLPACSQSNQNPKNTAAVEPPEMDIHAAVMYNNLEVVRQHIEAGTDINVKEPFSGSTPIITATTFGKTEIAKLLIDSGVDLSIANNDGSTPLHSAAFFCRLEIVQLLLDANADKSLRNKFGATPREIVMGPFSEIKPVYEMLEQQLAPMGLKLDMTELEKSRPVVAMMLQ